MPIWPFRRSQASVDSELLLTAVTAASRQSALFGEGRVADTLDGRFETMALHGALALIRLRAEPELGPLAQAFTDDFFRLLDSGLREEGVGDTSVPKRMHKLASAFYGRLDAYAAAIGARNNEALAAALGRNVMKDEASAFAPTLSDYALRVAAHQGERPASAMFTPEGWPVLQA